MSYTGQGIAAGQVLTWNGVTQEWELSSCALTSVLFVDVATTVPPLLQDGSICAPFDSISDALAVIPVPVSLSDQRVVFEVRISPGYYDEDLTIPDSRNVILRPEGNVILSDPTLASIRNITWTNTNLFGPGATLLVDAEFLITGGIVLADGGVPSITILRLRGVTMNGGGVVAQIDGTAHVALGGTLLIELLPSPPVFIFSAVVDAIRCPQGAVSIFEANILGTITVNRLDKVVGADIQGNISVNVSASGTAGFYRTTFVSAATFTGPTNSFRADDVSIGNFADAVGLLVAPASVFRLDRLTLQTTPVNITATQLRPVVRCTAVPITITLPTLKNVGDEFWIKDATGAASVLTPITILGGGGTPIDGAASASIQAGFGAIHVIFDGAGWNII